MATSFVTLLPPRRLESDLVDKKPLYSEAEARAEAERCLYCSDAPCIKACPTSIDIPTFIKKIASGNIRGAARTILEQNMLGYSCARVCPVEVLCVGDCVYTGWHRAPIQIGRLQRYATERATGLVSGRAEPADGRAPTRLLHPKPPSGRKVVCVGAGPASLACAAYLALEGHKATVLEKRALPGGLNTTGIAPYKLHVEDALHEVLWVQSLGVEIQTGVEVGKEVTGKQLLDAYDAVFLGLGLGDDTRLGLPGEEGQGVLGATAWIEHMKLASATAGASPQRDQWDGAGARPLGRVLVIGGGNTAIDMARECAQLGALDVAMVYRRSLTEMSGYAHELEGAKKEGVRFLANSVPVGFVRDDTGKLRALRVAKAESGRPVAGTEYELPCDLVGLAIGQSKVRTVAEQFPGVALDRRGCIIADPKTGQTGNPQVYSGGDCVNGGKEVVNAVADGRNAARHMNHGWTESRARHG